MTSKYRSVYGRENYKRSFLLIRYTRLVAHMLWVIRDRMLVAVHPPRQREDAVSAASVCRRVIARCRFKTLLEILGKVVAVSLAHSYLRRKSREEER